MTIICHDEKHLFPFPNFSDVENIRMVELAQYLVFSYETIHISDLALVNCLDCNLLLGKPIFCFINNAKSSLSDFLLKKVFILNIAVPSFEEKTLLYNDILVQPFIDNLLLEDVSGGSHLRVLIFLTINVNVRARKESTTFTWWLKLTSFALFYNQIM